MNNVFNKAGLFTALTLCLTFALQAQVEDLDAPLKMRFNFQVKQLPQFIKRFNYAEVVIPPDKKYQPSRKFNIRSLLNGRDPSLTDNIETTQFLKFIGADTVNNKINYLLPDAYAIAHCDFTYKGQPEKIDITLTIQTDSQGASKWVIIGVVGRLFTPDSQMVKAGKFISPVDQDTRFVSLTAALTDKTYMRSLLGANTKYNAVSAFLSYLRNGDVVYKSLTGITIECYQIPGWYFAIDYFNRADGNSGWLISKLQKLDEPTKHYLKLKSGIDH